MSQIRQCDRCGIIFPITEEGYSSVKGTVHRKCAEGGTYEENITRDFCTNCTNDMSGNKVPMPAIKNMEMPQRDIRQFLGKSQQ